MNTEVIDAKTYEFRRLNATDIFLMVKIIGKIGVSELAECFREGSLKDAFVKIFDKRVKEAAENENTEENLTTIGMSVAFELANTVIQNLPNCETEIYQLLSQVSNKKVNDIKNMDAVVFFEMIIDFVKKEEFKDFIKVVSKYIK
jgi:hypothetical protein